MLDNNVVVLDFETTGLSPDMGDRAIEIGAVKLVDGQVVDSFQALINPGQQVNSFIEQYTGISNQMLKDASTSKVVMGQFAEFIAGFNLVAHNASFDKKFLDAEFSANKLSYSGQFACSLLLSRRISQEAPNHKLSTLIQHHRLANDGVFHRALADATMTSHLWLHQVSLLQQRLPTQQITLDIINKLSRLPKAKIASFLQDMSQKTKYRINTVKAIT